MQRVGFVVFPQFQILDLAAVAVFELANSESGRKVYDISVVSEQGGAVPSSSGVSVDTQPFGKTRFDTVMVTGGLKLAPGLPAVLAFIQRSLKASRRTASICTGAFLLAEAGVLEGRRATTHWHFASELARRFPNVKLQADRIFIQDGPVWTSAGMTSCIDLALAMVQEDLGVDLSRRIAKKLVVYHQRSGGQSQFSVMAELEPKSDRIQKALSYAKGHLQKTLSVEQLAEVAHLSPRQFSRTFRAETGQSPAHAVELLRVEAARTLVEDGQHSLEAVAKATGFSDPERMRRAFRRAFGQPPQAMRRMSKVLLAA
ncbi:MAG: transcriptional regulator, AraC family [Rhizobacter sp.]|nr:transcriptional regulator, AraC family [Rhizobacter sp.]